MNRKFRKLALLFLPITTVFSLIVMLSSLSVGQSTVQQDCLRKEKLDSSFSDAVQDARDAQSCEQWHNLTPIVKENPKLIWQGDQVLMVSWRRDADCDPNLEEQPLSCMKEGTTKVITNGNDEYFLWVTPTPEIKEFAIQQKYLNHSVDLSERLKQYLGLRPESEYTRFVEIWINPNDLLRPCFDTEVADNYCDLQDANSVDQRLTQEERVSHEHKLENAHNSGYPFTVLGYTYDWGNPNTDIGASEFVVRDRATVTIHSNQSTEEYFQGLFP